MLDGQPLLITPAEGLVDDPSPTIEKPKAIESQFGSLRVTVEPPRLITWPRDNYDFLLTLQSTGHSRVHTFDVKVIRHESAGNHDKEVEVSKFSVKFNVKCAVSILSLSLSLSLPY